eukprot:358354-Chlamydomonas_euryale.AAC.8
MQGGGALIPPHSDTCPPPFHPTLCHCPCNVALAFPNTTPVNTLSPNYHHSKPSTWSRPASAALCGYQLHTGNGRTTLAAPARLGQHCKR